jgi:hypothetical protein
MTVHRIVSMEVSRIARYGARRRQRFAAVRADITVGVAAAPERVWEISGRCRELAELDAIGHVDHSA